MPSRHAQTLYVNYYVMFNYCNYVIFNDICTGFVVVPRKKFKICIAIILFNEFEFACKVLWFIFIAGFFNGLIGIIAQVYIRCMFKRSGTTQEIAHVVNANWYMLIINSLPLHSRVYNRGTRISTQTHGLQFVFDKYSIFATILSIWTNVLWMRTEKYCLSILHYTRKTITGLNRPFD